MTREAASGAALALGLFAWGPLAFGPSGCRSATQAPPASLEGPPSAGGPSRPLELAPLASIVAGVGLEWLADVRPGEILADESAVAQVARLVPAAASRFQARYGVDLRQAKEIVVAGYEGTLFGAAAGAFDPAAVEAAFARRTQEVEGRARSERAVRFWGTVDGAREQVAVLGNEAVAIEHGQLGPLRPAVLFAKGKLVRARPAVREEPLAPLFARLNDPRPPAVAFYAPGPFGDPWADGVGGLLRVTTAAAVAASCAPEPGPAGGAAQCPRLRIRVVLGGRWGPDGPAAGLRLLAAFRTLAADPLGHLSGLDHPLEGPSIRAGDTAVELDVTLDLASLASGIHDATGASLPEILGLSAAH